jgi:hypothetical protein
MRLLRFAVFLWVGDDLGPEKVRFTPKSTTEEGLRTMIQLRSIVYLKP